MATNPADRSNRPTEARTASSSSIICTFLTDGIDARGTLSTTYQPVFGYARFLLAQLGRTKSHDFAMCSDGKAGRWSPAGSSSHVALHHARSRQIISGFLSVDRSVSTDAMVWPIA